MWATLFCSQFTPQTGREQSGHRPALVLSPADYNAETSLIFYCLLTTQIKGCPFEVILSDEVSGAVLVDQVKSLDWRSRKAKFKGFIKPKELYEVRAKLRSL